MVQLTLVVASRQNFFYFFMHSLFVRGALHSVNVAWVHLLLAGNLCASALWYNFTYVHARYATNLNLHSFESPSLISFECDVSYTQGSLSMTNKAIGKFQGHHGHHLVVVCLLKVRSETSLDVYYPNTLSTEVSCTTSCTGTTNGVLPCSMDIKMQGGGIRCVTLPCVLRSYRTRIRSTFLPTAEPE